MKKYFLIIILLAWMPMANVVMANPYQVELLATSQADDIRAKLMKDGLLQVLANISDDKKIEKNAAIKTKITDAQRFVREYRYLPAKSDAAAKYMLRIRYNKVAVEAMLKKAGILKDTPNTSVSFTLQVSPIMRSEDVYALLSQIEHVPGVQKAELVELLGDTVVLNVSVQDSMEQFHQHTASHPHLVMKSQELLESKLIYEWSR